MTAGNDGTPENDDPFAYLYRSEDGEQPDQAGGQQAGGQPGVPRTSYHQVQRVGERRPQGGYGYPPQAPAQQGGYGYPPQAPPAQQQGGGYGYPPQAPYGYDQGRQQYAGQYGGPTAQYPQAQGQAQGRPPQQPGAGPYESPQGPPGGRRSGGGPGSDGPGARNRKGLLIAAVAVVAAVAIGIAFAMTNSSGDKKNQADDKPTTAPTATTAPSTPPSSAAPTPFDSKKVDVSTLPLGGGAQLSTEHPGASAANGQYVDHMDGKGASATWTVTVPKDDAYTFFVSYGNAGDNATLTLGVNGTPRTDPIKLNNYGPATDWDKAWGMSTFNYVNLKKGANILSMSCTDQDTNCGVNLDQVWLKEGTVKQ
jgi:hypothetical protein